MVGNAIGASAYGVAPVDKRCEANRKLNEEIINGVRGHINLFPIKKVIIVENILYLTIWKQS